jgi:hypothetical protein
MSKSIEFLRDLAHKLQTQDNAYTSSPNYCIQEYRLITGLDTDFGGEVGWFDTDNYNQADHKKSEALDRYYDRYGKEPDGWTRTGYDWHWRYTGIAFLTHDAAHAYVTNNAHRHENEIRIYVDSHYRNHEMREVRRLLAGPVVKLLDTFSELLPLLERDSDRATQGIFSADTWSQIGKANTLMESLDAAKEPHQ